MLAPIARLLDISTDTLLAFREELTEEEIKNLINEADKRLKEEPYEDTFLWAKQKIEMYPNCKMLIWQLAAVLDAQRLLKGVPDTEKYDTHILNWYEQVLDSNDEKQRAYAADSLYGYYIRKEEYEKAEKYLSFLSEQNPERKRKQAYIYSRTHRPDEAYRTYEELLFASYQILNMTFGSMGILSMEEGNLEKVRMFAEKQEKLAVLFEMGKYYEASCYLELATLEKDADAVIHIMQTLIENAGDITSFTRSPLYEHMSFKKVEKDFGDTLKKDLYDCFSDEDTYGFLKGDERWRTLIR